MTHPGAADDVEAAALLVSYGFRPKLRPHRQEGYGDLVRRYDEDPSFHALVDRCAEGLGLRVVAVTMRSGTVLGSRPGSVFEPKLEQYARQTRRPDMREPERLLHAVAHLAIAALSFPRPQDLADDGYVGWVTVQGVDDLVAHICQELDDRAADDGHNTDPAAEAPALERAWRAYLRRPGSASTTDGRLAPPTREAIVAKALRYLVDQGMLAERGDEDTPGKVFRTTSRYQLQVRDLAAVEAYDELLRLGVVPPGDATRATLRVSVTDPTLL
ncbi:hypothetical protein [Kitasatospora sp. NPDC005751]|uniref:hypothetical protein n=1 Tax=Kitasatospora sp. NPDC005751 TaxID=3157064 RepID=UPI0033EEE67C